MAEDVPTIDLPFLLAKLRDKDGDRDLLLREAHRRIFASELGRIVLLNHLHDSGVGQIFGPGLSNDTLQYAIGRHDAAVQLAQAAGYDAVALAAAILTDTLEEPDHDRSDDDHGGRIYVPDDLDHLGGDD